MYLFEQDAVCVGREPLVIVSVLLDLELVGREEGDSALGVIAEESSHLGRLLAELHVFVVHLERHEVTLINQAPDAFSREGAAVAEVQVTEYALHIVSLPRILLHSSAALVDERLIDQLLDLPTPLDVESVLLPRLEVAAGEGDAAVAVLEADRHRALVA